MKKFAIAFIIFASSLSAQVQLGKNVQIGASVATGTVTEVDTNTTSGISGGPITLTGTIACEQGSASQFGCVKADGTTITASGGVLTATGTGASGVQYNPATTSYIVATFSGWDDDGDANSRSLGVPSSVSCSGTSCSVTTATSHGLSVKGAVDFSNLSSWPGGVYQAAQYGSLQVATTPTGTTFTTSNPRGITYSCSPCTGNIYDASFWGIWQFAKEPYIYGHGTVYQIETTTANLDTNFTTLTSGITGTPTFLIDNTGVNDFAGGATAAAVNTSHQNVWAKAHTAGMIVMQTSITPAQYGLSGQSEKPANLNVLLYPQSDTSALVSTGQYYDRWCDVASVLNLWGDNSAVLPDQSAASKAADKLNECFSNQKSSYVAPLTNFTYSVSGLGGNGVPGDYVGNRRLFFYNNGGTWTQFMDWNTGTVRLNLLTSQSCIGTDSNGTIVAGTCGGSGLSGMTSGQVPIAATATTVTSSKALLGTDASIATATGSFSTSNIAGGDANGGVTPITALPNGITATTQSALDNSTKVATTAYVDAAVPPGIVSKDTSTPVSVSSTACSGFYNNQNATAATAVTYNLPTAAACANGLPKQFCFTNSNNGSAADTGVLTIATSATGQFIIFTDGTLSATGGNVTSGGAASDAACVVEVDTTHWQLYVQRGTWTKH